MTQGVAKLYCLPKTAWPPTLPGGEGHLKYLDVKANPKLRKNLEKDLLNNKDKYIIARCATPSDLFEGDLIKNRKSTCNPGCGDKIKKN